MCYLDNALESHGRLDKTMYSESRVKVPYSDKFGCGENLAQLAQNGKHRQSKSARNLIFFSLCQIKSMAKNLFF